MKFKPQQVDKVHANYSSTINLGQIQTPVLRNSYCFSSSDLQFPSIVSVYHLPSRVFQLNVISAKYQRGNGIIALPMNFCVVFPIFELSEQHLYATFGSSIPGMYLYVGLYFEN